MSKQKKELYIDKDYVEEDVRNNIDFIEGHEPTDRSIYSKSGKVPRNGVVVYRGDGFTRDGSIEEAPFYYSQPNNIIVSTESSYPGGSPNQMVRAVAYRPDDYGHNVYRSNATNRWGDEPAPKGKVAVKVSVVRHDPSKSGSTPLHPEGPAVYWHEFSNSRALELISSLARKNIARIQRIEERRQKDE